MDAVATSPAVLRDLAAALAADRDMLRHGAPPVAGRLAGELIARGSSTLTPPACARCGRAGMPLTRTAPGPCASRARHAGSPLPARTAARLSLLSAATPLASGSANGAAAMTADIARAEYAARPRRSSCGPAATASRTSVPAATGCRRLSAACAARRGNATSQAPAGRSARRARHGPPRAAPGAGRTARPLPAGQKARSATRATQRRCAVAGHAPAADRSGGWSLRPGRALTPARTAPGSRSPTPAVTADSRTSFTRKAAVIGAA